MYHLDSDIYGNPQYPLGQMSGQQFVRSGGTVGRGLYRAYNPTAPFELTMKWKWIGETLEKFRADWDNAVDLNRGANWFTIDLPLHLNYDIPSSYPYDSPTTLVYSAVSADAGGGDRGYENPAYDSGSGEFSDPVFLDTVVRHFKLLSDGSWSLRLASGAVTGNPTSIKVTFSNSDEEIVLNFATNAYVSATGAAPIAAAAWDTDFNTTQMLGFSVMTQGFQRYVAHFKGPFNAAMIGYNVWEVSANVEVDISKALTL